MRLCFILFCAVLLSGCLGSANRPLQLLNGAGPIYPAQARANGLEGEVVVRYAVNVDGVVVDPQVVSSNPEGVFDAAAVAAVASWRYAAPINDGQRVAVPEVRSVVRFRLDQALDYLENE
ncbi:MAG: energy transducer TonB [Pseudomonadales bacterium]